MEKIIKKFILNNEEQTISYKEFMELSLYHPKFGYYNQPVAKIGKNGDFYTSSNIGDIFGRTLGRLFLHIFETFCINPCIIELGGGTGKIARAVLQYFKEHNLNLYKQISYTLVESSNYHQRIQKQELGSCKSVSYVNDLENVYEINGIVFSNEFFDAFPVHVIEKVNGYLFEVMITVDNDKLKEKLVPLENGEIRGFLSKQQLTLIEGQRMEIPLAMVRYYEKLCEKIKQGVLLTIDYGYTNKEWSESIYRQGSLRGYNQHRLFTNVLHRPGKMDLTTHIHWDALYHDSFQTNLLLSQTELLLRSGILQELRNTDSTNPLSIEHKRNRAIRTLIDHGQISKYFRVLLQTKQIDCEKKLIFPY